MMRTCGYKPDGRTRCTSSAAVRIQIMVTDGVHKADRLLGVEVCSEHVRQDWSAVDLIRVRWSELSRMLRERFPEGGEHVGRVEFISVHDTSIADEAMKKGDVSALDNVLPVEMVRLGDLPPELVKRLGFRLS